LLSKFGKKTLGKGLGRDHVGKKTYPTSAFFENNRCGNRKNKLSMKGKSTHVEYHYWKKRHE
jgi:hypothetical protein